MLPQLSLQPTGISLMAVMQLPGQEVQPVWMEQVQQRWTSTILLQVMWTRCNCLRWIFQVCRMLPWLLIFLIRYQTSNDNLKIKVSAIVALHGLQYSTKPVQHLQQLQLPPQLSPNYCRTMAFWTGFSGSFCWSQSLRKIWRSFQLW